MPDWWHRNAPTVQRLHASKRADIAEKSNELGLIVVSKMTCSAFVINRRSYAHRKVISNGRIVKIGVDQVAFKVRTDIRGDTGKSWPGQCRENEGIGRQLSAKRLNGAPALACQIYNPLQSTATSSGSVQRGFSVERGRRGFFLLGLSADKR